jgi:hypothetical protein
MAIHSYVLVGTGERTLMLLEDCSHHVSRGNRYSVCDKGIPKSNLVGSSINLDKDPVFLVPFAKAVWDDETGISQLVKETKKRTVISVVFGRAVVSYIHIACSPLANRRR